MGAIVNVHSLKGDIQNALDYILDEEKTENILTGCTNSSVPELAGIKWKSLRNANKIQNGYSKNDKDSVKGYHFILSFDDPKVSPEICYEIAEKFLKKVTNDEYDSVISVHKDTEHIHAHMIVNSNHKETGKQWDLYYKKEINRFKKINDEICKGYGIEPIQEIGSGGKSWWKHHHDKIGDSYDIILIKTLDYLVDRVQTYEQLKMYLRNIGYIIEDGLEEDSSIEVNNDLKEYEFTLNKKMISEQLSDEYSWFVRIPFTKDYMQIPKSNGAWIDENNTTLKCRMDFTNNYLIYDSNANIVNNAKPGELIASHLESKNKFVNREGLRIKVPGSKKFRRCKYLKNPNNPDYSYSLESIIERINGNDSNYLDENIANVINSELDINNQKKAKNIFYENANIKTKYNQSEFYNMSKKEKYMHFKSAEIQKNLDRIAVSAEEFNDVVELKKLKNIRRQISNELKSINSQIRSLELKYKDLEAQMMEEIIAVSSDDLDEFIGKNLVPLRQEKFKLKKQYGEIDKRIKKAEKNLDMYV